MTATLTLCACGHSVAAHSRGQCQGIDLFGLKGGRSRLALELCSCPAMQNAAAAPTGAPAVAAP